MSKISSQRRRGRRNLLPLLMVLMLAASHANASDLAGIWKAKRIFGPEVRGTLTIVRREQIWEAEIGSYRRRSIIDGNKIAFQLQGKRGEFVGSIQGKEIVGHWIQPSFVTNGTSYASPVTLKPVAANRWAGEVFPLQDEFTLYLKVQPGAAGTHKAFLRNPDRNLGLFLNIDRLELDDTKVKVLGTFLSNKNEITLAEGTYHVDDDRLSIYIGNRGGTFDFARVDDDPVSGFYPRGINPAPPYTYAPPPAEDDGWQVSTLEDAGIAIGPIKDLIEQVIQLPAQNVRAPYVHGLLIARHGIR